MVMMSLGVYSAFYPTGYSICREVGHLAGRLAGMKKKGRWFYVIGSSTLIPSSDFTAMKIGFRF